jgi:hypothetical protein
MSSIDRFSATLNTVARANRFEVVFTLPKALPQAFLEMNTSQLSLRLQSVTFPGKNITTTEDTNIYGPSYEVAQGLSYADSISMTFLMKNTHAEKEVFNEWQDIIVDPVSYDLEYYNNYITNFECYQLDELDRKTAGIELIEVFPKTVNPIEFSQAGGQETLKLQVDFAFREWIPIWCDPVNNITRKYPGKSPTFAAARPRRTFYDGLQGGPDRFIGREKKWFEDVSKAFNDGIAARNKVVGEMQKIKSVKNFFKGITNKPFSNLGIGGFGGF